MRSAVLIALCFFVTVPICADQVTCGSMTVTFAAGGRASCTAPGVNVNGEPVGADARATAAIVNGQFQAISFAELDYSVGGFSGPTTTFSATWDDIYHLPASPASDIFEASLYMGGLTSSGSIRIGSNAPFTQVSDVRYYTPTVERLSAASNGTIELQGNWSFVASPYSCCGAMSPNLVTFGTQISIERFKANGVTPDPFISTPEPAALPLAGLVTLSALALWKRRRKVRRICGHTEYLVQHLV